MFNRDNKHLFIKFPCWLKNINVKLGYPKRTCLIHGGIDCFIISKCDTSNPYEIPNGRKQGYMYLIKSYLLCCSRTSGTMQYATLIDVQTERLTIISSWTECTDKTRQQHLLLSVC